MAENRTFTLIGKFDDGITKKLKGINQEISKLNKPLKTGNFTKSLTNGLKAANKEVGVLQKHMKSVSNLKIQVDKSGLKAASQEAQVLRKQLEEIAKNKKIVDTSGLRAAQEDAKVLGKILEANALIKVGEGFANALTMGAQSAVSILQRGMGFIGKQFSSAVADQMEDLQARGSLYGSLTKQGVLTGKTPEEMTRDYRQTKVISRANEQAIGQLIRTSSVSTGTVTTLNRQLTDNLLPTLLKARGITDLGSKSREELDKLFGGEKGIGTELAKLYEQMAILMPNPQYARMGAMGFTQAISSGTINRQLAIFENNPVLVDALKTIDGGIQSTSDIGKRIQILKKALEVAAPTMMLDEMRNTIAGGMQAVQDTIMNPTVGILSLGADVANEGKETLKQYQKSKAYAFQLERAKKRIELSATKQGLKGAKRKEYIAKQEKEAIDKLNDAIESADSPIEKISIALAPVLQSFATMLSSMDNLFLRPVTKMMESLYLPLASLQQTFDFLASDIEAGKRSAGEALGRAVAEIFKALANYFNPTEASKDIGDGIQKFFSDFKKGFDSIDGSKFMKTVMDSLSEILMKALFVDGNPLLGVTPLGDALAKVFLALAAPTFISALITGLTPIAITAMGSMITKTLAGTATAAAVTKAAAPALVHATPWLAGAGAAGAGAAAPAAGAAAAKGGGVIAALTSIPILGWVVLLTAAFYMFQSPLLAFAGWLQSAGITLMKSQSWVAQTFGFMVWGLGAFIRGLTDLFAGLADFIIGLFTGDIKKIQSGFVRILNGVLNLIAGLIAFVVGGVGGIVTSILTAIKNLFIAIWDSIFNIKNDAKGSDEKPTSPSSQGKTLPPPSGSVMPDTRKDAEKEAVTAAKGSPGVKFGSLAQAIDYEMKNKPPGSDLVIANSSETIIPAADGLNMGSVSGVIDAIWKSAQSTANILARGFAALASTMRSNSSLTAAAINRSISVSVSGDQQILNAINRSIAIGNSNDKQILAAIKAASAAGGLFGGLGSAQGSLGSARALAQSMGLVVTSHLRPGDPGYHGVGRAMDFSNSTGPTPEMMRFAQTMVARHGRKLTELIYTPLGFSIKNGNKVAPLSAGNHYNHVHVAYALGKGNPAFFSKQSDAESWEKKMMPSSAKLMSVTANTSEGMGKVAINAPITIYQQPGQDPEELASLVAMRIGMVVEEMRNHR